MALHDGGNERVRTWRLMLISLIGLLVLWSPLAWAQQPQPGGVLKVAYASDILHFNLHQGPPPGYEVFWVWNNTHNSLVRLDPDFNVAPDLAETWDILEDGRIYVFHLRTGGDRPGGACARPQRASDRESTRDRVAHGSGPRPSDRTGEYAP
jgi:ABC-type transport system substrate-binding protein